MDATLGVLQFIERDEQESVTGTVIGDALLVSGLVRIARNIGVTAIESGVRNTRSHAFTPKRRATWSRQPMAASSSYSGTPPDASTRPDELT